MNEGVQRTWTRLKSQVLSEKGCRMLHTGYNPVNFKKLVQMYILVMFNTAQNLHGEYPHHLWGTGYLGEAGQQSQPQAGIHWSCHI